MVRIDLYGSGIKSNPRPYYIEEQRAMLLGYPIVKQKLVISEESGLIYRDQINDYVNAMPQVNLILDGDLITFEMWYEYRSYSYYQAYGLEKSGLNIEEKERETQIKEIDEETGEEKAKRIPLLRKELKDRTYKGQETSKSWSEEDYFTYTDSLLIRVGTYQRDNEEENRVSLAFEQYLRDLHVFTEIVMIGDGISKEVPKEGYYYEQIQKFWEEIDRYRSEFYIAKKEETASSN